VTDAAVPGEETAAEPQRETKRRRRRPEVRIGFPAWAPFAFVGVFALGVILGVIVTVLVDDDRPAAAAETTTTRAPAAPTGEGPASPAAVGSDDADDPLAYRDVEIAGTPLPRLADGAGGDPAVGMPAPGLVGTDFDGNPVSIDDDGRAKIIVFLAHWCPYCQQEIPIVRDWVAAADLPDNVDVYSVSTLTDPTRPNYPPAEWFTAEEWNVPLIADDGDDSAAGAFGLNAVPFWVLVNTDNTVAGRGAGAVPAEVLRQVADELAAGPQS